MMNAKNKIAVLYISDKNYHVLTEYSIASIARSHNIPLDFIFFQVDYNKEIGPTLRKTVTEHGHQMAVKSADFVSPSDELEYNKKDHGYTTYVTALKAKAIDAIAHQYDRILYLDGDVLAFTDIHLEQLSDFDQLFAASFDVTKTMSVDEPMLEPAQLNGLSPDYFNAGVIMINSKKWIQIGAATKFAGILKKHEEHCPYFGECVCSDQCTLNILANDDWLRLPILMNVQQSMVFTKYWKDAHVRHYTGPRKFLSMRNRNTDPREYKLVKTISSESELPYKRKMPYDGGLIYYLNSIRRTARTNTMSRAAAEVEKRILDYRLASTTATSA